MAPNAFNAVALSVDDDVAEAKSRLVHIALLNLNLRFMENWRSAQIHSDGSALDYESLMILMAIIVIGAERVLRTELEDELQTLALQLPSGQVGKVNLSSIASATGINRETVRRRVNNLQKAGWVERDRDGVRTVQGVIPYEDLRTIIGAQVNALTLTANQLARMGVLSASMGRR
jgi:DNA-binding MarR family transcriptional regulator